MRKKAHITAKGRIKKYAKRNVRRLNSNPVRQGSKKIKRVGMEKFIKTIEELEKVAIRWWPDSLKKETADISVIPLLLESQEDFIAILRLCTKNPLQVFDLLEAAKFPANLFLKHLVVLTDYGGETIRGLNANFYRVFEELKGKKCELVSLFQGKKFSYAFEALPIKGTLSNAKLGIDGANIQKKQSLDPVKKDLIMILLYGALAENALGGDLEKCEIGTLLGKDKELDKYVRQKYIWVSRITRGATANTQGQLAQTVVLNHLRKNLDASFNITGNGVIKLKDYDKKSGMPFDLVVEKKGVCVGIEVSFQVTTNSVIERKGGLAQDRQKMLHAEGHKIAYVIDGAGNFHRRSAVSTICKFSDCTVAYSEKEFSILVEFIKNACKN